MSSLATTVRGIAQPLDGSPRDFDSAASEILDFVRMDVRNRIARRFPLTVPLRWPRRMLGKSNRKLTRTGLLEHHYEKHLYGDTSLFQLPERPQLHMLTTNLSEGCLCAFSRTGLMMMRRQTRHTFRIDRVHVGLATVAMAVTASSAFPGFFPPLVLTGADVGASMGEFGQWLSRMVNQVLPFAGVTMVIFAFALDADSILQRVAPGLVWLATMFSMLVLVQRSFAIETADGALDALRVAGVDPRAIYLGKAVALGVQLLILEVVLLFAAVILYGQTIPADGAVLLVIALISATCGLAAVGTLYGGLAAGFTGRETLLPLLTFPAVAPVLIGATRAVEAALGTAGAVVSDGWPWVGLLVVFAVAFGVSGALAFGPLIDE